MELVSWIIAPVVCIGGRRGLGGLTFGLSGILEVFLFLILCKLLTMLNQDLFHS